MATKAQSFRARAQRESRPPQPKHPPHKKHVAPVQAAGNEHTAARNVSGHAGRRGGATLEDSANGKPSRKSTRRSADHTKRTTNLQLRETRKVTSPSARAAAGKSSKTKAGASAARR
jgi:hypothetical protein